MQQYADIYLLQSHFTCFGCHSTHHQDQTTLEESSSTSIMTYTRGSAYSFSTPDDGRRDARNM